MSTSRTAIRKNRSLKQLVDHFITNGRSRRRQHLAYYRALPTLKAVIEMAGMAIGPDGKRSSHQRRIPKEVLVEVRE